VQFGDTCTGETPHSFNDDVTSVDVAEESLASGEIVWFVSHAPVPVSATTTGGPGTVGVSVALAVRLSASFTTYVTGVFAPGVVPALAAKVTTPVVWFKV
jgi:hypothetical protein